MRIIDLVAIAGDRKVDLIWTAPNLNGGLFVSYDIFYGNVSETISDYSTTRKTITGLSNDVPYTFTVRTSTSVGVGLQSNEATATPIDPTVPSQITDLSYTTGDTTVTLTWTAPNLNRGIFDYYDIFYFGSSTNTRLLDYSDTSITFTRLANSEPHVFTVYTRNSVGISIPSNAITAIPLASPSQITDLKATAGDESVTLTWTAPNLNGGEFVNYEVISSSGLTRFITEYSTPSLAITGLSNGVSYTFTVRTQSSAGISILSNAVTVTPAGLPSQITDLRAVVNVEEIILIWTVPNLNGGLFVSYDIFYGNVSETISDYSTTRKIITLSENIPYTFTISTTTDLGTSILSNEATATPVGFPSRITDLVATAGDESVTLTWTAPKLNGGEFENYEVISSSGLIRFVTEYSTPSLAITGLSNDVPYTFTVRTSTSVGVSLQSDRVTVTPTSSVTPLVPQCVSKVGSGVIFGNQIAGQTSDEEGLDISNIGNMPSNIFLKGTDWIDDTDRSVMDIGQTRYSGTESSDFQDKTQLSNSNVLFDDSLESGVTGIVYLQLSLDLLVTGFTGTATQTITVVTSCDQ